MTKSDQDKWCRAGDPEGMHLASFKKKTIKRKFMQVTDEEFQAYLNESTAFAMRVTKNVKF